MHSEVVERRPGPKSANRPPFRLFSAPRRHAQRDFNKLPLGAHYTPLVRRRAREKKRREEKRGRDADLSFQRATFDSPSPFSGCALAAGHPQFPTHLARGSLAVRSRGCRSLTPGLAGRARVEQVYVIFQGANPVPLTQDRVTIPSRFDVCPQLAPVQSLLKGLPLRDVPMAEK